ncbi:toll/interleukin-1 receptor domain-containing protein [Algoriphagus machipongonensis]|uniref:TIR domain-containing protein n=1 Tax=Algoriphagus machipongonensis TaxID=388413 RepID=A3I2H7_9BACT|nr:toll/interleukin-1 receptor domain-containing protein [Algoriphagus machipongonensis]EAZ79281.1 hypothetical protein ALPR1_16573 [Algoriphagus machipongonensis]
MAFDPKSIFISYAWGGLSEEVANELDQLITEKGLPLVRDKRNLGFKGLIKDFMRKIGTGNSVLLVISDKYLKSPNCMFELLEVQKKGNIHSRVFPIVLGDANIYKPIGIISYLRYWEDQIDELNKALKDLDSFADTQGIRDDIDLYTDIRGAIAQLANIFRDMNTLSLEEMKAKNYSPLLDQLLDRTEDNQTPSPTPSPKTNKYGKVLYHIPDMMQIEAWTRCIVRLAWDEILLKEGLNLPKDSEVIEEIRLGKVMQVNLEEGKGDGNFEIDPLSSTEQFIFEDDYTEWLFDVRAKKEGTFTLVLRVTLLQIIEGFGERKKDIVLERNVKTEAFVPESLPNFEVAQSSLAKGDEKGKIYPTLSDEMDVNEVQKVESLAPNPRKRSPAPPPMPAPSAEPIEREATSPGNTSDPKPKSVLRKLMPYAASIAFVIIAGIFILPNFNNQSSPVSSGDMVSEKPSEMIPPPVIEAPNLPITIENENVLISIKPIGNNSAGQGSFKAKVFLVNPASLDSLYSDSTIVDFIPISDTVRYLKGNTKIYSAAEIKDSIKTKRKPAAAFQAPAQVVIDNN